MIIPKMKKYRSVKRFRSYNNSKIIHKIQFDCYNGHFPMKCNNCVLSYNCWFCGLKGYKEV